MVQYSSLVVCFVTVMIFETDAMIIKAVSSGCAALLMFLTAAIVYVLRKKVIVVREAREHNAERAFNWI